MNAKDKKPRVTENQIKTLRLLRGGWPVNVSQTGTDHMRSATLLTKKGLVEWLGGWDYRITDAGKAALEELTPPTGAAE